MDYVFVNTDLFMGLKVSQTYSYNDFSNQFLLEVRNCWLRIFEIWVLIEVLNIIFFLHCDRN